MLDFPSRLPDASVGMKELIRHGWVILSCVAGVLVACHGVTFQGARPMPGNGPNGADLRSPSQVAVGLAPAPGTPLVYPITLRINAADKYTAGVTVEDPYRWLEDLDSDATRKWVEAQNQISKPRLESIPHRAWLKQRLTALWNYERFGVPIKRRGGTARYFYVHNDGTQNQSVLYVSENLGSQGRVLFDPN